MTDIVCSVFTPIQETGEDGKEEDQEMVKNDDNNNSNTENMNKNSSTAGLANLDMRRKESRKPSHFDINTIMEEIDDLAQKRDSSPTPPSSQPLPKTAREFIQRKKYEYLNFSLPDKLPFDLYRRLIFMLDLSSNFKYLNFGI